MNRGFANIAIIVALIVVVAGAGWWYMNKSSAPATSETTDFPTMQQNTNSGTQPVVNTQPTKPTQTTPAPTTSSLVIHGIYSLRAAPDLKYLGFSLYAEGPTNPLDGVTQLFFNDESSGPGHLAAPSGSSFTAVAGDLRPRPSCDLEIDVTVEIKNPVFENRSGESIGNYRVVSGDFVRVVKRGQVTDVCSVDNGHGGTTLERTTR